MVLLQHIMNQLHNRRMPRPRPPFSSTDSSDSSTDSAALLRHGLYAEGCRRLAWHQPAVCLMIDHWRLSSNCMLGQGPGIIFLSHNQTSSKLCRFLGRWLIYLMLWGVWMAHRYQYWRRTITSISIYAARVSMRKTYRLCVTHN